MFWTSPQALENMWIGRGRRHKRKSFRRGMVNFWDHVKKNFSDYGNAHSHAMAH